MTNSVLQVTNFDFYGDKLTIIRNIITNETYIPVTSALRTIGFSEKQAEYQRIKWSNDSCVVRDIVKLKIPTKGGYQETFCLSTGKFFSALLRISVTPKMKRTQPMLAEKLSSCQIKFDNIIADYSFNHFKTHNTTSFETLLDEMISKTTAKENNCSQTQQPTGFNRKKHKYSYWRSQMFNKCQMLMDYMNVGSYKEIYKQLYREFENYYPEFNLNDVSDEYCIANNLDTCFTMDAIEHNKTIKLLFENMVDTLLEKYGLVSEEDKTVRQPTIFDN